MAKKKFELTDENYYSQEANKAYLSCSQIKDFMDCEAKAMARLNEEYEEEKSIDLINAENYKNANLNPKYTFDSFVVGASVISDIGKNDRIRVSLRTLIEELLKYHKPIIANDLENMNAVELIVKSGIEYVSSDALSKMSEMILPLEKKKMEKIVTIANQY